MATAFDDVRLPVDIEIDAEGGAGWQTTIVQLGNGGEQRNQDWEENRHSFDVGYGISSLADLRAVRDFHKGRRGRARAFRFKDWMDFELDAELIALGDTTETDFQIIKTYSPNSNPYVRRITRPITSTVEVYLDGVLQTIATNYTLLAGGIVHFLVAPGLGVEIRITCEFDIPMRFDIDAFRLRLEAFEAGTISGIMLIEVPE